MTNFKVALDNKGAQFWEFKHKIDNNVGRSSIKDDDDQTTLIMIPHHSWQKSCVLNKIHQSWSKSWIYPQQNLFLSSMRIEDPSSSLNNVKFTTLTDVLYYMVHDFLYWGSIWQLSKPYLYHLRKRSSYNHHHFSHDHHHHHPHITPVKMRESLKFSFLPTSSSPPAVVSAIILSINFANKV